MRVFSNRINEFIHLFIIIIKTYVIEDFKNVSAFIN